MTGLPPCSALLLSVCLLGSTILSCVRQLHSMWHKYDTSNSKTMFNSLKRDTLPYILNGKKRFHLTSPGKPFSCSQNDKHPDWKLYQAPGIGESSPETEERGKQSLHGPIPFVPGKQISPWRRKEWISPWVTGLDLMETHLFPSCSWTLGGFRGWYIIIIANHNIFHVSPDCIHWLLLFLPPECPLLVS